jgi:hypothetical protein
MGAFFKTAPTAMAPEAVFKKFLREIGVNSVFLLDAALNDEVQSSILFSLIACSNSFVETGRGRQACERLAV